MTDVAHTPGIDGWSGAEARAVLAAMADVAAQGPHSDDKANQLIEAAGEHILGIDVDASDSTGCTPGALAIALGDYFRRAATGVEGVLPDPPDHPATGD